MERLNKLWDEYIRRHGKLHDELVRYHPWFTAIDPPNPAWWEQWKAESKAVDQLYLEYRMELCK